MNKRADAIATLGRDAAALARVLAALRIGDTLELDDMADAIAAPVQRVVNALAELALSAPAMHEAAHA